MLPRHRLLGAEPLHSLRAGTNFDPRTMTLRIGRQEVDALAVDDDHGPGRPTRAALPDDSVITRVHEGIHWRQFVGTSLGAFLSWLRHARESAVYLNLRTLPADRRRNLLAERRVGRPILALDEEGLPDPRIRLTGPPDAVEVMRAAFFDSFTLETLFLDPTPLARPYEPLEQILSATVADAATSLAPYHPLWSEIAYDDVQAAFSIPDRDIRRVAIHDPQGGGVHELTTRDILEAGAVANELLLASMTREQRYHSPDGAPISVWTTADDHGSERFRSEAGRILRTAHGIAARHLFAHAKLDPEWPHAWLSLAVACDFALNPPLPPFEPLPRAPRSWGDLYPARRFDLAALAMRRIGGIDRPDQTSIAGLHAALAEATGLTAPAAPAVAAFPPLPDFEAIVREGREAELNDGRRSHYDFLVWAQARNAELRRDSLPVLAAPGWFALERFAAHDLNGLWRAFHNLAGCPPIEADADDAFIHAAASTPAFGTWFATSCHAYGLAQDLMFGTGAPDPLGLPVELVDNERIRKRVRGMVRGSIGDDPWD